MILTLWFLPSQVIHSALGLCSWWDFPFVCGAFNFIGLSDWCLRRGCWLLARGLRFTYFWEHQWTILAFSIPTMPIWFVPILPGCQDARSLSTSSCRWHSKNPIFLIVEAFLICSLALFLSHWLILSSSQSRTRHAIYLTANSGLSQLLLSSFILWEFDRRCWREYLLSSARTENVCYSHRFFCCSWDC